MTPPRRPGPILFNVSNEYRRISSSLSEHQVVSTRPSSPPSPAHVSVRITTNPFKPAISAGPHGGPGGRLSIDATFFKGVTRGSGGGAPRWPPFYAPDLIGREAEGRRLSSWSRACRNTCLSRRPSDPDHLVRRPRRQRLANPAPPWRRDVCVLCMRDLMRIIVKQHRICI